MPLAGADLFTPFDSAEYAKLHIANDIAHQLRVRLAELITGVARTPISAEANIRRLERIDLYK